MKYLLLAALSFIVSPVFAQPSFAPVVNYPCGGQRPYRAAVGDINGDGKADIVVANSLSNGISVLLGQGQGIFSSAININAYLAGPYSIVLGDINADGILDIVTCNDNNTAGVLLGNGANSFSAVSNYSTGASGQVQNALLGDVNNDGKLDIIAVNFSSSSIAVLVNDGTGHFPSAPVLYSTGANNNPQDLALGDFNGDGRLDVVVPDAVNNSVEVLLNNGIGGFPVITSYSCGAAADFPVFLAVADVNNDGRLDIASANQGNATVSLLLNVGSGRFATGVVYSGRLGTNDLINIGMGDINGDNRPDIIVPIQNRNLVKVLLNNGNGTFTPQVTTFATGQQPYSVTVTDLNADNKADLLTPNIFGYNLSVLLNTSSNTLSVAFASDTEEANFIPNPSHTSSRIFLPTVANVKHATVRLTDELGGLVRIESVLLGKFYELDVSNLRNGLYFLQVQTGETNFFRRISVE